MTTYNLKVINKSGAPQTVALYQKLPNVDGHPLVWFSKYIVNGNTDMFTWDIDWGLGWGTTSAPLKAGVTYQSHSTTQSVTPSPGVTNGIKIGYSASKSGTDGDFTQSPMKVSDIGVGELKIDTTADFSDQQASNMCVAVYVQDKPVFAMQGRPNGNYLIDTHPVYYMAMTDAKESTAVSGTYISNPTKVEFEDTFNMECTIDNHLMASCVPTTDHFDL